MFVSIFSRASDLDAILGLFNLKFKISGIVFLWYQFMLDKSCYNINLIDFLGDTTVFTKY